MTGDGARWVTTGSGDAVTGIAYRFPDGDGDTVIGVARGADGALGGWTARPVPGEDARQAASRAEPCGEAFGAVMGIVFKGVVPDDALERFPGLGAAFQEMTSPVEREAIRSFRETLGHHAKTWFDDAPDVPGQDEWNAAEAAFSGDTDIGRLLRSRPLLARTAIAAWSADHGCLAPEAMGKGAVDGVLARTLVERMDLPASVVHLVPSAEEWILASPPDAVDAMPEEMRHVREDFPAYLARNCENLPHAWIPRTHAQWAGFTRAMVAVDHAHLWTENAADLASMLRAGDGWDRMVARLAKAAGTEGWVDHVTGIEDMVGAFSRQVVLPALAMHDDGSMAAGDPHATCDDAEAIARLLLLSGGSLRRALELSARWHRRSHAIEAVLDGMSPAELRHAAWPAGLPDAVVDGVSLTVLTTRDGLRAEGGAGPDGDGADGLDHCVANHVSACLAGRCRVLSLRRHGPDGPGDRLSTAEVAFQGAPFAVQHAGLRNAPPPPEAEAALSTYMAMLEDGRLAFDAEALEPTGAGGSHVLEYDAGYAWRTPGAWETVLGAWSPLLRRDVRGMGHAEVAALRGPLASHGWVAKAFRRGQAPADRA